MQDAAEEEAVKQEWLDEAEDFLLRREQVNPHRETEDCEFVFCKEHVIRRMAEFAAKKVAEVLIPGA